MSKRSRDISSSGDESKSACSVASVVAIESEINISLDNADQYISDIQSLREFIKKNVGKDIFFTASAGETVARCRMRKDQYIIGVKFGSEAEYISHKDSYSENEDGKVKFRSMLDQYKKEDNKQPLIDALGYVIAEAVRFHPIAAHIKTLIQNKDNLNLFSFLVDERGRSYMQNIPQKDSPDIFKKLSFIDMIHSWAKLEVRTYYVETEVVALPRCVESPLSMKTPWGEAAKRARFALKSHTPSPAPTAEVAASAPTTADRVNSGTMPTTDDITPAHRELKVAQPPSANTRIAYGSISASILEQESNTAASKAK